MSARNESGADETVNPFAAHEGKQPCKNRQPVEMAGKGGTAK
jgi:hypothetical protein